MEIFLLAYVIACEIKDTRAHRRWMRQARAREQAMIEIIIGKAKP